MHGLKQCNLDKIVKIIVSYLATQCKFYL